MKKILNRTVALILAVMLCLGVMPLYAFAQDVQTGEEISSEVQPSEAPEESSQLETYADPVNSPAPEDSSSPVLPEEPEATTEPDSLFDTELSSVDAYQVWPALRKAAARAGVGTGGVLQIGYYCFSSAVGVVPTLGEYVSEMPAKTMVMGGTHVAAYCLEHVRFVP